MNMKHHDCSCGMCTSPKPAPCQGFLLPKIIANGREWLRRQCFALEVEGLPACAQPPYALVSVYPCGDPGWEPVPDGRPLHFRVTIPLLCQVRDGCGCIHTGRGSISLCMQLHPSCPLPECWRSCMMVLPCVRLVCAECSHTACFQTQLEVMVEAYLLRWEPCMGQQPCKPKCPELPLYPQPYRI